MIYIDILLLIEKTKATTNRILNKIDKDKNQWTKNHHQNTAKLSEVWKDNYKGIKNNSIKSTEMHPWNQHQYCVVLLIILTFTIIHRKEIDKKKIN